MLDGKVNRGQTKMSECKCGHGKLKHEFRTGERKRCGMCDCKAYTPQPEGGKVEYAPCPFCKVKIEVGAMYIVHPNFDTHKCPIQARNDLPKEVWPKITPAPAERPDLAGELRRADSLNDDELCKALRYALSLEAKVTTLRNAVEYAETCFGASIVNGHDYAKNKMTKALRDSE